MNHDRADVETRDDVEQLVRSFYRDAAMDDWLGPIFAAAGVDWPSHIDRLTDFWCWQLLGEGGYAGNPLRAHLPAHARTPFTGAHFERWLELFTAAVDHEFQGPTAELAKVRATKMATALRRLLTGSHSDAPSVSDVAIATSPRCFGRPVARRLADAARSTASGDDDRDRAQRRHDYAEVQSTAALIRTGGRRRRPPRSPGL